MKKKIQLLESGIPLVDKTWGGFYRGGTYLLIGPKKSGRTLLGLQFASEAVKQNETCIYFTSMRPKDLLIHAASIDFDLQQHMNNNVVVVVKVSPPAETEESANPDDILIEYLNDIVSVVEQYQPSKLVFDELTPFIGFHNINLLHKTYSQTIEKIEEGGLTSLILLGQPVTPGSRLITDTMINSSTGIIYLEKNDPDSPKLEGGKISIIPLIGHTEGEFSSNYSIEPYKGIVDDYSKKPGVAKSKKYKTLDQFNAIEEKIMQTNLYPVSELKLMINNQIAMYKSTGQTFHVIVVRIDPDAEKKGILTFNQLRSSVILSLEKKDKISLIENKIVILIPKSNDKSVASVAAKIRMNLPGRSSDYLNEVLPYVSVFSFAVNDRVRNAEDVFQDLLSDDTVYNGIK